MTKKMDFGGVGAPVVNQDFGGAMGFSLNPLDWFSSETKTFTPAQELSTGNSWIQQLHAELKPNATLAKFIESLHLDSYNAKIPEEDYQDFVRTVGFAKLTNVSIADRVRAAIVKSFSSNKNMLPTRKSISSGFLNPDNVSWTYWDATKMVASDAADVSKAVINTAASAVSGGAKILSFVTSNLPLIAGVAVVGIGFLAYKNRGVLMERINEKALKTVGLGK